MRLTSLNLSHEKHYNYQSRKSPDNPPHVNSGTVRIPLTEKNRASLLVAWIISRLVSRNAAWRVTNRRNVNDQEILY